mmetsp:Transcript_5851/g.8498  ORF Transcript_5851/g.8498 Transcript_5851/m.8498 type:complete len:173 (+) Transcript_5851:100-618(+)
MGPESNIVIILFRCSSSSILRANQYSGIHQEAFTKKLNQEGNDMDLEVDIESCGLSEEYKKEVKRQNRCFFCILTIMLGGTALVLETLNSAPSELVSNTVFSDSNTFGNDRISESALDPKDLEAILELRRNRTRIKKQEIFGHWNRTHPGQPFPVGLNWMQRKSNPSNLTKH